MSGYRLIHREQVLPEDVAVWSLVTTPLLSKGLPLGATAASSAEAWRLWAACSDGLIRVYRVHEVSLAQKEASLTAAALTFGTAPTHLLVASDAADDDTTTTAALGYAALDLQRNHAGQDEAAGDVLVVGMDLGGVLRIWTLDEFLDDAADSNLQTEAPTRVPPTVEIPLPQATGTLVQWAPPRFMKSSVLLVAVAFLDGSVALVSTGLAVAQHDAEATSTTKLPAAGTVMASWGSGLPLACCLCFRPQTAQLAVSRQDGSVELIDHTSIDNSRRGRVHRLSQLATAPARALCFTTDGHLLVGGNDLGRLVVWDVSRTPAAVVNHQSQACKGSAAWLWHVVPLDDRRLVTLATDASLSVWQVDSLHHQPLHAFGGGGDALKLWSVSRRGLPGARLSHPPRLVAGSENGCFQVYSIVEKS
jgi:WD40 repeat protein